MTFVRQNGVVGKQVIGRHPAASVVGIRECVVVRVHYTDQQSNRSGTAVEYDLVDLLNGQVYNNALNIASSGDKEGGAENVLRAATTAVNAAKPLDARAAALITESDADRVLVGFINASSFAPVILGVRPHPQRAGGATSVLDGHRRYLKHEGTTFEVQSDGTYVISRTLPTGEMSLTVKPDGAFEVVHPSGSTLKVGIDGSVELEGSNGDSIRLGAAAAEHAVKGDSFKATFDSLVSTVNTLIAAFTAHKHDPVSGVPTYAPAAPTPLPTANSMPATNLSEKVVVE